MKVSPLDVYRRLLQKGLTKPQACGVLGNFMQESGFDTQVLGFDKTGSIGLAQWLGSRKAGLIAYAKRTGRSPTDWTAQVDWMFVEFNTTESSAFHKLLLCSTAAQAALAISKYYERPAAKFAHNDRRVAYATDFYNQFT